MFSLCSSFEQSSLRSTTRFSVGPSKSRSISQNKWSVPFSVLAASSRCTSASVPNRTRPHQFGYKTSSTSRYLPEVNTSHLGRNISATRSFNTTTIQKSESAESPATAMSLTIRPVAEADKETWLNLWAGYNTFYKRTIPTEVTETTFTRFLDFNTRMYCAVAEDPDSKKVIGFITWYPHISTSSIKEIVYIHDLFVDPTVRNRGTGRKLIEHVYEEARKLPASQVYWTTQYYNYVGQILYTKIADRTDFVKYMKIL